MECEDISKPNLNISDLNNITAVPLRNFLKNDLFLAYFHLFLKEEHSEENLLFWLDTELFESMESDIERREKALEIYRSYLNNEDGPNINIRHSTLKKLQDALECGLQEISSSVNKEAKSGAIPFLPSKTLFKAANKEIYSLMQSDSFERFEKSQFFTRLKLRLSKRDFNDYEMPSISFSGGIPSKQRISPMDKSKYTTFSDYWKAFHCNSGSTTGSNSNSNSNSNTHQGNSMILEHGFRKNPDLRQRSSSFREQFTRKFILSKTGQSRNQQPQSPSVPSKILEVRPLESPSLEKSVHPLPISNPVPNTISSPAVISSYPIFPLEEAKLPNPSEESPVLLTTPNEIAKQKEELPNAIPKPGQVLEFPYDSGSFSRRNMKFSLSLIELEKLAKVTLAEIQNGDSSSSESMEGNLYRSTRSRGFSKSQDDLAGMLFQEDQQDTPVSLSVVFSNEPVASKTRDLPEKPKENPRKLSKYKRSKSFHTVKEYSIAIVGEDPNTTMMNASDNAVSRSASSSKVLKFDLFRSLRRKPKEKPVVVINPLLQFQLELRNKRSTTSYAQLSNANISTIINTNINAASSSPFSGKSSSIPSNNEKMNFSSASAVDRSSHHRNKKTKKSKKSSRKDDISFPPRNLITSHNNSPLTHPVDPTEPISQGLEDQNDATSNEAKRSTEDLIKKKERLEHQKFLESEMKFIQELKNRADAREKRRKQRLAEIHDAEIDNHEVEIKRQERLKARKKLQEDSMKELERVNAIEEERKKRLKEEDLKED